jgi:hypothetical protein
MENRILEEQEKKFRQLTAILANLPRPDNKSGFFAVRCGTRSSLHGAYSTFSIVYSTPGRRYSIEDLSVTAYQDFYGGLYLFLLLFRGF